MSSSKKFAGATAATLTAFGGIALVAALAAGLAGWPPASAAAAPRVEQGSLGIGSQTSGPSVLLSAGEKVSVDTTATPTLQLQTPAPMVLSLGVKKPAKTAPRRVVPTRRAAPAATGGWRTARVSWYGPGFYGHTMAGGGTLQPTSMVVAHRSLPFGTRVEFQYRGRTVIAVVKDRGPYVGGRTFDLGPGTAHALGFGGVGTVSYRILGR